MKNVPWRVSMNEDGSDFIAGLQPEQGFDIRKLGEPLRGSSRLTVSKRQMSSGEGFGCNWDTLLSRKEPTQS